MPETEAVRQARILIVTTDASERDVLTSWLTSAGYQVVSSDNFHDAKRRLEVHPPDLLIAAVRLGEYNGLHLAIRVRFATAGTSVLIIGDADPVLQSEASRQLTRYLTPPLERLEVLELVGHLLARYPAPRRSVRKRIIGIDAVVNGARAVLIDLSYEGVRLEMSTRDEPVPASFVVRVPTFRVECAAHRVWVEEAHGVPNATWCGAAVEPDDVEARTSWRRFVDAVAGAEVASLLPPR